MIIFDEAVSFQLQIPFSTFEMNTQTIFVELLGEGTQCWRPVRAEPLGDESYRIIDPLAEDEDWAFAPGDTVKCKMHRFANGDGLLAHQKVDGTRNST
jgi:hypothetical protein